MRGGEWSARVGGVGRLKTGIIVNLEHLDIQDFLVNSETPFLREIQKVLRQENAVKVYGILLSKENTVL